MCDGQAGDLLIKIPVEVLICSNSIRESKQGHLLNPEMAGTARALFASFVLLESLDPTSFFRPYLGKCSSRVPALFALDAVL